MNLNDEIQNTYYILTISFFFTAFVEKNKRITHYMFTKSEVATLYIMSTNYNELQEVTRHNVTEKVATITERIPPYTERMSHTLTLVRQQILNNVDVLQRMSARCSVLLASKNLPIIYTTYASVFNDIGHTLSKSS